MNKLEYCTSIILIEDTSNSKNQSLHRNLAASRRVRKNMRFYSPYLALSLVLGPVAFCADLFPSIEAENLLGKKVELPEAAKGAPRCL